MTLEVIKTINGIEISLGDDISSGMKPWVLPVSLTWIGCILAIMICSLYLYSRLIDDLWYCAQLFFVLIIGLMAILSFSRFRSPIYIIYVTRPSGLFAEEPITIIKTTPEEDQKKICRIVKEIEGRIQKEIDRQNTLCKIAEGCK